MRLLVIGWDSADWSVLEPLLETGRLPGMQQLLRAGARGRLRSTLPALTPPAWTTLATGVNPGRHGILNFWSRLPGSYRYEVVTGAHRHTRAVWDWLNRQGMRTGVLHYPITFPPEPVQGFFVSGWYVPPGRPFTYPAEARQIIERDGPYRVHQLDGGVMSGSARDYLGRLCRAAERQTQAAVRLAREYPVDVLWTVYLMTDWGQHFLWNPQVAVSDNAALGRLYATMDRCLTRLLEELAPERVLLLSDHGAGPVEGVIHANSLLEHLGFLTAQPGRRVGAETEPGWRRLPLVMALRRLKGRLARQVGRQPDLSNQIDFTRSRAYSLGSDGAVFINLRGREPQGVLEPGAEYEEIREELAQALLAVCHPETGHPLIERVYRREEIYRGPAEEEAPDLVFVTQGHRFSVRGGFGPNWFTPPGERAADHRREGIWIAAAPECTEGIDGGTMDAADFVPSLLALLQAPIPAGLDGTVHEPLFRPEWLASHPPSCVPVDWEGATADARELTEEEEEAISRRLRDLGYME